MYLSLIHIFHYRADNEASLKAFTSLSTPASAPSRLDSHPFLEVCITLRLSVIFTTVATFCFREMKRVISHKETLQYKNDHLHLALAE